MNWYKTLFIIRYRSILRNLLAIPFLLLIFAISNSQTNAQNPQWMVFDTLNSIMPTNGVRHIVIDDHANKWFVSKESFTISSVVRFGQSSWSVFSAQDSTLPVCDIEAIAIDKNNDLWIGSNGIGLMKFSNNAYALYDHTNSAVPYNPTFFSIAVDSNNTKWIGTIAGLLEFSHTSSVLHTKSNSGLTDNWVWSVAIDSNGDKWIGTREGGLIKFNDTTWFVYDQTNSLFDWYHSVRAISITKSGIKWFAANAGLFRFNDTIWTRYDKSNTPLLYDSFLAIAADSNGHVWLGTNDGFGMYKFDGTNWTHYYKYNSGLPNNTVPAIVIDAFNNKWIGTWGGGLAVFNETGVVLPVDYHMPEKKQVEVYPNPADQYVVIRSSGSKPVKMDQIEVFSITGVKQNVTIKPAGQSEWTLVTSILPNGIYLARVTLSNRERATVRFIIRR
jgi:ligand-binding sensor domain-containing protein